jgi:AraC-like DNA-binding protein
LYGNNTLTESYPVQDNDTCQPASYLSTLLNTDKAVTYMITSYYSYYGCIKIQNSSSYLFIGSVSSLPYTRDSLFVMRKEFSIVSSKAESFSNFFNNIPAENLDTFINTLLLINYTVSNKQLTREHITDFELYDDVDVSISKKYSENSFLSKEEGTINDEREVETELLRYIETGKVNEVLQFYKRAKSTSSGIIADNSIRQLKNEFIVIITLACRAAIKGGLSETIAYPLAGVYIQQAERLIELDTITSLLGQALLDFTNRVANSIIPPNSDSILHNAVQYVRKNTNRNIIVSDVADHIGFSRSYLSRKFKKEIGFELSMFIRQCKLEEAKDLLAYSSKSINEISNYLCFSDQSHFQKVFKNQFGITPQAYRKSL